MNLKSLINKIKSRPHPRPDIKYDMPLTAQSLKQIYNDCQDLTVRELSVGGNSAGKVSMFFIDGLVDSNFVSQNVIRPLTDDRRLSGCDGVKECIEQILSGAVFSNSARSENSLDNVVGLLVKGFCVIVFDRDKSAIVFECRSPVQRGISEPTLEKAVKGAKDSFIERLRMNTMLVRRKLRTPDLKLIQTVVGRRSGTDVAVAYMDGIADPGLIKEVQTRLDEIDIDGLLATANLEEYISDNPRSPFPQVAYTERPDRFAMALLEGRVGLLVDGLPLGFLLPCTLSEIMRVPEDRSQHFMVASVLTLMRYLAMVVTVLTPALYVAIAMYHQEMIPIKLLLSIIQSKQDVPFNTGVEIIGMLVAFEILQEAGLRLPNPVGQTISIIGALIVGQSAVEAKVISPIAVIVVATAGITGYTMPSQDLASVLRLWRFCMVICALFAGLFGIIAGLVMIICHLCNVDSFGLAFLSPLADGGPAGVFRLVFRKPLYNDKMRDPSLNTVDKRNQK